MGILLMVFIKFAFECLKHEKVLHIRTMKIEYDVDFKSLSLK